MRPSRSMTAAARRLAGLSAGAAAGLVWPPVAALAHIKWFEPYDVSARQVPVLDTLSLPAFWAAIALVLAAFLAVTVVENRIAVGRVLTSVLDRLTAPLRMRADRVMLCVIGAFFVALFAVGTTILTPELLTGAAWVAWVQLGIALCLFSRRLYKLAALGIAGLWCFALADYDLFHMLDYVALGLGLAGYLWLASTRDERWRSRRFDVLRWGVALALMWSSMEKFGYPAWFTPLLEKKPYLALGLPFPTFTTMCGVAEFTLAFGLLWSPLIRRLSALGFFALMTGATYPFGRTDLIGHATILAALLLIAAGVGGGAERYTVPPRSAAPCFASLRASPSPSRPPCCPTVPSITSSTATVTPLGWPRKPRPTPSDPAGRCHRTPISSAKRTTTTLPTSLQEGGLHRSAVSSETCGLRQGR